MERTLLVPTSSLLLLVGMPQMQAKRGCSGELTVKLCCWTRCEFVRELVSKELNVDKRNSWHSCLTRAIENECILAMTNVAGPTTSSKSTQDWTEDDAIAVGRTCVCAPFVGCVGKVESGDENLLLSAVDLRVLEDARSVYRCRQDIKKALCDEQK